MPNAKSWLHGLGWVLALILFIKMALTPTTPDRLEEIEALQVANDSLKLANEGLEQDYQLLLAEEDSMKVTLQDQKNRIVELKEERNEQMDRVLDLDHDELFHFFTNYPLPSRKPNPTDSLR